MKFIVKIFPFYLLIIFIIHTTYSLQANVLITGCTGVLGWQMMQSCESIDDFYVHGLYRSKSKLDSLLKLKQIHRSKFIEQDLINLNYPGYHKNEEFHTFFMSPFRKIIVNNAGCCLKEMNSESFRTSIFINVFAPLSLILNCLHLTPVSSNNLIINISSGDGELIFLNSIIKSEITSIKTINSLIKYTNNLIKNYHPTNYYAHGDAPYYSLSKALQNQMTRILSNQIQETSRGFKILACCPGNFLSPMTTFEEINSCEPVSKAASHILDMIQNPERFSNGQFYRYGEKISM